MKTNRYVSLPGRIKCKAWLRSHLLVGNYICRSGLAHPERFQWKISSIRRQRRGRKPCHCYWLAFHLAHLAWYTRNYSWEVRMESLLLRYKQCWFFICRIVVPNTNLNVDLSGEGNAEPGTPVELWGRWDARNQVWHFEQGVLRLGIVRYYYLNRLLCSLSADYHLRYSIFRNCYYVLLPNVLHFYTLQVRRCYLVRWIYNWGVLNALILCLRRRSSWLYIQLQIMYKPCTRSRKWPTLNTAAKPGPEYWVFIISRGSPIDL